MHGEPAQDGAASIRLQPGVPWPQRRLRLYLVVMIAVVVGGGLLRVVAHELFRSAGPAEFHLLRLVAATALAACLWATQWTGSRWTLAGIDAAATAIVGLAPTLGMLQRPPGTRPEMGALLAVTVALCLRAALVPSSTRRTLLVGSLAMAPVLFLGPTIQDPTVIGLQQQTALRLWAWGLTALAATAVTSRVIYGLHRRLQLGPYELGRQLGRGGMGVVYEARHALLRRPTAVKLVRGWAFDSEAVRRFEREARVTSELSNPNTVALYDYGSTEDGTLYYAMELIDGLNLLELIELGGPVPAARAAHLLRQMAASLAEAHSRGLVHRDIKPSNVMVCRTPGSEDLAKVLDFGLASRLEGGEALTAENVVLGTPQYLAPETIGGIRQSGPAADVYAAGAVGYYLLTGAAPFDGPSLMAIVTAHLLKPPPAPSARSPVPVPQDLEEVILRCLAKSPDDRYADGAGLLEALDACATTTEWNKHDARRWWDEVGATLVSRRHEIEARKTSISSDAPTRGNTGHSSIDSAIPLLRPRH